MSATETKTPTAPLFTVITVTFNAEKDVPATLRSVREQTFDDFEHLIVDGASTDATLALARDNAPDNQTIISSPDRGLYDAMNRGIGLARGKYLIFLNAGDAFHSPDTLSLIARTAADNDYPGIIYGQTDIVDSTRRKVADRHLVAPRRLTYDSFREGMVVCHQAFIALRRIVEYYDIRYKFSADYEWCIRVLQHSRNNCYIDDVLVDYMIEGMTTRNRRKSLIERFKVMSYYYGFLPTVKQHLKFIPRYLRRRRLEKSIAVNQTDTTAADNK